MTDSEAFLADIMFALEMASGGRVRPAREALDWLRNRAPRGRGVEPGWGGQRVHLLDDRAAQAERTRMVFRLRAEGYGHDYIASKVHLSVNRVAHLCMEAGVHKGTRQERR